MREGGRESFNNQFVGCVVMEMYLYWTLWCTHYRSISVRSSQMNEDGRIIDDNNAAVIKFENLVHCHLPSLHKS